MVFPVQPHLTKAATGVFPFVVLYECFENRLGEDFAVFHILRHVCNSFFVVLQFE
jgi:hypothetical protein